MKVSNSVKVWVKNPLKIINLLRFCSLRLLDYYLKYIKIEIALKFSIPLQKLCTSMDIKLIFKFVNTSPVCVGGGMIRKKYRFLLGLKYRSWNDPWSFRTRLHVIADMSLISQVFLAESTKFLCSLYWKFPELFKTHPTFICSSFLRASTSI